MNREQAEHILDAYLSVCHKVYADGIYADTESEKARDALREVILDAMTEYRVKSNYPSITYPYATWVDTTKLPTNWDGTPKVTCTGIDPAFNTNTVSTVDGTAMAVGYQDGVVEVVGE